MIACCADWFDVMIFCSRVFTIICRRQNEIRPLKEFLFDVSVSSSLLDILDKIVIVCFCVWPTVFIDASLPFDKPYEAIGNSVGSQAIFLSVQVLAIYQSAKREDPQIYKVFLFIFNYKFVIFFDHCVLDMIER